MIYSAKQYKLAKVFLKDIEAMLKVINQSITAMSPYGRYIPAKEILTALHNNKAILTAHEQKCRRIIANKGAITQGEVK